MNKKTNVLVTGGAGYIGSHTAKALHAQGYTPVVFDNLSFGHKDFVKWGPFIEGDVLDTEKLITVLREYNIQDVIHFAAFAYVGESVENPGKYYRNNVAGSLSLLQAMQKADSRRIVFSSTCATYGQPKRQPIAESENQNPINPYGQSKLMVESMLKDFAKAHSIKSVALRYFNAAGADPEAEIGERHSPETHLIPLAIQAALGCGPHLKVFGKDYATADGTCLRDYIHVQDLANAHIISLKHLHSKSSGFEAFNLGSGKGSSVLEVIAEVERELDKKVPYEIVNRRPGDPAELVADPKLAKKTLGWKCQYSLKEIISHACRWHKQDS